MGYHGNGMATLPSLLVLLAFFHNRLRTTDVEVVEAKPKRRPNTGEDGMDEVGEGERERKPEQELRNHIKVDLHSDKPCLKARYENSFLSNTHLH